MTRAQVLKVVLGVCWLGVVLCSRTADAVNDLLIAASPNPDTISAFEFQVVDDSGQPINSLTYSYSIYHPGGDSSIRETDVAYKSSDGVLRLKRTEPSQGRIRIWVAADDGKQNAWHGYESYSFDLNAERKSSPPTIKTERIRVVAGRVVSVVDGSPIHNAEVAPAQLGHHGMWSEWDDAVKTNEQGEFRITDNYVDGVAARHENFGEEEIEFWQEEKNPETVTLKLHPAFPLRGRTIDAKGLPIEGVRLGSKKSDKDGRFLVMATRQKRLNPDFSFSLHADGYEYERFPLSTLSFDKETDLVLKPEKRFHGQVVDQKNQPILGAKVDVMSSSRIVLSSFYPAKMLGESRWEYSISKYDEFLSVRVTIDGVVQSVETFPRHHANEITTKLPIGHKINGTIGETANKQHLPWIALHDAQDEVIRWTKPAPDGSFQLMGIRNGQYMLAFYPEHLQLHNGTATPDPAWEFADPAWQQPVTIDGSDFTLRSPTLAGTKLMPGRVEGVAVRADDKNTAHANVFIYVCDSLEHEDSVGNSYYVMTVMTDSSGRFVIDPCPPGRYALVTSDHPNFFNPSSSKRWVNVRSGKTTKALIKGPLK